MGKMLLSIPKTALVSFPARRGKSPFTPLLMNSDDTTSIAYSDGITMFMHSPTAAAVLAVSVIQNSKSSTTPPYLTALNVFDAYSLIIITPLIILLEVKKYTEVITMFERFAERARESLFQNSSIHISGRNEIIIDCCQKIEECSEVYMRIISGGMCLNIRGTGLRAYDFRTGGLVIRGELEQIEFTERRSRNEHKDKEICPDKCTGEKNL